MKNLLKYGFLAIALTLSVAACNTDATIDSDTDTTIMADTMMMDTTMIDTMMTDTTTF